MKPLYSSEDTDLEVGFKLLHCSAIPETMDNFFLSSDDLGSRCIFHPVGPLLGRCIPCDLLLVIFVSLPMRRLLMLHCCVVVVVVVVVSCSIATYHC